MAHTVKQKLGAALYDLPRFLWSMRPAGKPASANDGSRKSGAWLFMRNRDERLILEKDGLGVCCDWQWTSDLHLAKVFPALGRRLMKRTLDEWPIKLCAEPFAPPDKVDVSFIIGHRGTARLPHLLATLRSIASQRNIAFECIVVEQSIAPEVAAQLPKWVRYVHTPLPSADAPFNRSWAFNAGARTARGKLLVLHDNDMLVPQDYATELMARYAEGYEIVNLKRFIFYLTEAETTQIFSTGELLSAGAPEAVMQNAQGGGSLAVGREAYFDIGGFDESFVGWGNEDNEFWERAQTRKVWPYTYLPLIHLWHPAQPGKHDQGRATASLFARRSAVPAEQRIRELKATNAATAFDQAQHKVSVYSSNTQTSPIRQ